MIISKNTIQEIQNIVKIEDIISDFVVLKKKGQNLWACCPFHNERTPSFSVSPHKGFFKCFGCDAKGDAITFLQLLEGMNFVEAIKYIAEKYAINIETETQNQKQDISNKEELYILNEFAQNHYQNNLKKNQQAMDYLDQREINDQSIEKFHLGYASNDWRDLYQSLQKKNYNEKLLQKSNLIIYKDTNIYDRFRDRIIFPIHNLYGKTIAFAGRVITKEYIGAKYINSPESDLYNKSHILYGIFQAKVDIVKKDKCILVEGYTDVIALHQAGITNVVASGGTSLTIDQIRLLKRFTNNISIIFDSDEAGISASKRGINIILEQGMDVKIVTLPKNEDPDSFVTRVGGDTFMQYYDKNEIDFITYESQTLAKHNYDDPLERSKIINQIINTISHIPDIVKRSLFLKKCSTILDIEEAILSAAMQSRINKSNSKKYNINPNFNNSIFKSNEIIQKDHGVKCLELYILKLLICYGEKYIDEKKNSLKDYIIHETDDINFKNSSYRELYNYIKSENIFGKSLLYIAPEHLRNIIIDCLSEEAHISINWSEKSGIYPNDEKTNLQKSAFNAISKLKLKIVNEMIYENQKKIQKETDDLKLEELLKIHTILKNQCKSISENLGIVIY